MAPTLVGIDVAIAVFAVNFSFVAFQLAPYRQLLAGPSWRHVAAAGALLFTALLPLVGLPAGTWAVGRIAVAAVPLLVVGALGLVVLALSEASPRRLLVTRTSDRAQAQFLRHFADAVAAQARAVRPIDPLTTIPDEKPRVGTPMHELGHRLPPPTVPDDPFEICVAVAHAAVERDDALVFVPAVERLVSLSLALPRREVSLPADLEPWELKEALDVHVRTARTRVEAVVGDELKHAVLLDRFMEVIARTVREAALAGPVSDKDVIGLYFAAAAACRRQIERGSGGSGTIGVLIAARQACELGSRRTDNDIDPFRLAAYVDAVQSIGETAIDVANTAPLYQCLETLGWIGCSALRIDASEIGRHAAGALVQLGRVARHRGLECHWDRCALTPYQHAEEHLRGMMSWVPKTVRPDRWLDMFDTAFSRLIGRGCEFEYADGNITPNVSDEPHVEGYRADGGSRRLDYSNEAMLKQQTL